MLIFLWFFLFIRFLLPLACINFVELIQAGVDKNLYKLRLRDGGLFEVDDLEHGGEVGLVVLVVVGVGFAQAAHLGDGVAELLLQALEDAGPSPPERGLPAVSAMEVVAWHKRQLDAVVLGDRHPSAFGFDSEYLTDGLVGSLVHSLFCVLPLEVRQVVVCYCIHCC